MTDGLPDDGPYKGLVPYSEEDAPFFFGREADRDILIANLLGSRLTLLYGASGVGKSSLLHAGVVYHLRQLARQNMEEYGAPELAVVTFSAWQGDPLPGLLQSLKTAVTPALPGRRPKPPPATLGLADALRAWTEQLEGSVLILLDQFEEYFLYHPRDQRPGGFADELARAINEPDLSVGVLIAIREDALAWLDRFKGRIPGLFENYLRLDHLDRSEARKAIEGPVAEYSRRSGQAFRVEPELVRAVLDQVTVGKVAVGEAGRGLPAGIQFASEEKVETPYLQLVMSRIWEEELRLGSRVLRGQTLVRLGGAERLVQTHLDTTLAALSPEEQVVAARIFRYLVTPRGAKIALAVGDLADFTDLEPVLLVPVLQKLAAPQVRILRPLAEQPEAARYEIFHDVLAAAALDWRRRFERTREQAKAAERLAGERRRSARLLLGVIGLGLLLTAMVALTFWALRQRARADQQARLATAGRLAIQALNHAENELDLALLLSVEGHRRSDSFETRNSLLQTLQEVPQMEAFLQGSAERAYSVAFTPDGKLLAASNFEGVKFWSMADYQQLPVSLKGYVSNLDFSPDGEILAMSTAGSRVHFWSVGTWQALGAPLETGQRWIRELAFVLDGRALATSNWDGLKVFSTTGRQELARVARQGTENMAFDRQRKIVATGGSTWVRLSSLETGMELEAPSLSGSDIIGDLALSPDGELLAATTTGGKVLIWSRKGRWIPNPPLSSGSEQLFQLAFSPDGRILAARGQNGLVHLWSMPSGSPREDIRVGREGWLTDFAFSPDGQLLATAGRDERIYLWSPDRRPLGRLVTRRDGGIRSVAFSPDGRTLAMGCEDGTLGLWRMGRSKPVSSSAWKTASGIFSVAFSEDGKTLAAGSRNGKILLWSVEGREPPRELPGGHKGWVSSVTFGPDGSTVASGGEDGAVRLWSAPGGKPLDKFSTGQPGWVSALTFAPDGKTLAAGYSGGMIRQWSLAKRKFNKSMMGIQNASVTALAFSPDGNALAAADARGRISFWSPESRSLLGNQLTNHTDQVLSIAFSPDGRTLASGSKDGTVRLWSMENRQPLGKPLLKQSGMVWSVSFSPDGRKLASAASNGSMFLWDTSIDSWRAQACRKANRNLSPEEWRKFVGPDVPYERTCPELPPGRDAERQDARTPE